MAVRPGRPMDTDPFYLNNFHDVPLDSPINLTPPTTENAADLINLNPLASENAPVPDAFAERRAYKHKMGFKNENISYEEILDSLRAGNEDTLRSRVAADLTYRRTMAAERAISKAVAERGSPLTENEASLIRDISKAANVDPSSVFEVQYAKEHLKYLDMAFPDRWTGIDEASRDQPQLVEKAREIGGTAIAKREFALRMAEDANTMVEGQTWIGWGADQLKLIVPGYREWQTKGFLEQTTAIPGLVGTNLYKQSRELLSLPFDEYKTKFSEIMAYLKTNNPTFARDFAAAVVGRSSSEEYLDNIFGALDVFGAGQVLLPIAGGVVKGAKAARQASQVKEAFKQMTKAADPVNPSEAKAIEATGDVAEAAVKKVTDEVIADIKGTVPTQQEKMLEALPSYLKKDAEAMKNAPESGLSREITNRILENLNTFTTNLTNIMGQIARVERVPEIQATEKAVRIIKDRVRDLYPTADSRVLDVGPLELNRISNTYSVEVRIGTPHGELFSEFDEAENFARWTGLGDGYTVRESGKGWFIGVQKTLDETDDVIRNALVSTDAGKSPDTWLKGLITRYRTSEETLSLDQRMNRKVSTFAPSVLEKLAEAEAQYIKDLIKGSVKIDPITGKRYTALHTFGTKRRFEDWERIVKLARTSPDKETGDLGTFFRTPGELEQSYLQHLKRMPDEVEVQAYFAYARLVEYDRVLRNLAVYRNKARLGTEQHSFYTIDPSTGKRLESPFFEGVIRKDMPRGSTDTILILGKQLGDETVAAINKIGKKRMQTILTDLKEGRKVLVEVFDPEARNLKSFGKVGNSRVRYVLADAFETKELAWEQVPRRGGGHWEYDYQWYVKQAKIRKDGGSNWYEGDTTLFPVSIRAMGDDFGKIMNEVRGHLLANNTAAARQLVKEKLPVSWEEVNGWFKPSKTPDGVTQPPRLSLDQPFYTVGKGSLIKDMDPNISKITGYRDGTTEGSLARTNQVEFTGQRDSMDPLGITNLGTREKPLFELEPAKFIDPLPSINRALSKIINSTFMDDYKIFSAEHWLKEAQPYLKNGDSVFNAPFHNFAKPEYKNGIDPEIKVQLESIRKQMNQFMGIPSETEQVMHSMSQKIADQIYSKGGGRSLSLAAWNSLPTLTDPIQAIRGFTFHTSLGLWSVPQLLVQTQTFVATASIAGMEHAGPGAMGAMFAQLARYNRHPALIAKFDEFMATSNLPGMAKWKVGEFTEAHALLESTGFGNVAGEYAIRDNVFRPKIFKSGFKNFLDAGTIFFTEGERAVRYAAWFTAYREARKVKPTGRFTEGDVRNILERADTLSLNMSRASNSSLHQGLMSIPAQFLTYQLRMAEMMFGKRLTTAEKSRLIMANAVMYGVPTSIGVSGLPLTDMFRNAAQAQGYIPGENWYSTALMEGLPTLMLQLITGNVYNVGDRYGVGGFPQINDAMESDKPFYEMIGGAAWSKFSDTWVNSNGFRQAFMSAIRDDGVSFPFKLKDVVDSLKAISSVTAAQRLYYAMNTSKWLSKKGTYLTDVSAGDAWFMTITGLQPRSVSDAHRVSVTVKDKLEAEKKATDFFVEQMRNSYNIQNDNPEEAHQYRMRAISILNTQIPEEKREAAWARANEGNESLVNSLDWSYYIKNAPKDKAEDFFNTWVRKKQLEGK